MVSILLTYLRRYARFVAFYTGMQYLGVELIQFFPKQPLSESNHGTLL